MRQTRSETSCVTSGRCSSKLGVREPSARDQIHLEVLLDIRDLLSAPPAEEKGSSLLEKAQAIKQLTKLR